DVVETVGIVLRPRLARCLADTDEVFALGAVFPVLALAAAEVGGAIDGGDVLTAVGAAVAGPLRFALGGVLGARKTLDERLEGGRRFFLGLEEGVLLEHLPDFLVQF